MSDRDLFDAVARKTGEDSHDIARRGGFLTGPDAAPPVPIPGTQVDLARARPGHPQGAGRWSFENIEDVFAWPRSCSADVARG